MAIQREKVNNPFGMGIKPGKRIQYKPDLQSQALPRSAFQAGPNEGALIVDSLVKFAGVAGDAYVKKISKEVEADKIEQAGLAMEGFKPSDKATVAGYQAHAAIRMKNKAMEEQLKLNQLATEGVDDETWKLAKREAYKNLDSFMMENYDRYKEDENLQKLAVLTLREMMPQVTAKKLAADMDKEINQRIVSGTDALINAAQTGAFKVTDPEVMRSTVDTLFGALKLTASQKDKIWISAIENTQNPDMIEASKYWMGDHTVSLYNRSGRIQQIQKKIESEKRATNAVDLAIETKALTEGFYDGTMTEDEFLAKIDKRNKELDGHFMTQSKIEYHLNQKQVVEAVKYRQAKIQEDLMNPEQTDLKNKYKKKEIQATYNTTLEIGKEKIREEAKALPETEQDKYIKEKETQLIAHVTDMSVKSDALIDSIVSDLHNLATINVQAASETIKTEDGEIVRLAPTAQRAMETFDAMSIGAKDQYLEALDAKDAKTVRNFYHLKEMGMPDAQALDRAQLLTKNPKPIDYKAVDKAVDKVRDSQEYFWWRKDIPESQSSYMDEVIRKKVMVDPDPTSETNVEMVSNWLKEGWTNADGLRLQGSPSQLQAATKLHPSRFKNAFKAFVYSEKDKLKPMLDGLGLELDDVFPVTDPKHNTMSLRTKYGNIPGTTKNLDKLRAIANKRKVELEKAAQRRKEAFEKTIIKNSPRGGLL